VSGTGEQRKRPRSRPAPGLQHGKYGFIVTFLLLPVGLYVLYSVSPYLQAFFYSLTDWGGFTPDYEVIGFENYTDLFSDDQFLVALGNNAILMLIVPAATVILGLFFASMLNVGRHGKTGITGVRGSGVYKIVYFFPQVLSIAIVGVLFKYVFAPTNSGGILNNILVGIGLDSLAVPWLGDPRFAFWCVVLVMIWSFVGFYVVLFSAAMQSIPKDVYEAALLDGANRWTTFWKLTLPLVWDTVQVGWVYMVIQAIDGFALVNIMLGGGGGPNQSGDVLGVMLYRSLFDDGKAGFASAIGVILLLMTLFISVVFMRLARRERVEY